MRHALVRSSWCLAVAIALLLPAAYADAKSHKTAGPDTPMEVLVTNGPNADCDPPTGLTRLQGDTDACATSYVDNTDCDTTVNPSCIPLRVKLISGGKTLTLDTRGTDTRTEAGDGTPLPRTLILDFIECVEGACVLPPGTIPIVEGEEVIHKLLETPGLLEVFLNDGVAKFWFTDSTGVEWRVHWNNVGVSGDCKAGCTLTAGQAGLSQLTGKRTKPGDFEKDGRYNIPFELTAAPK